MWYLASSKNQEQLIALLFMTVGEDLPPLWTTQILSPKIHGILVDFDLKSMEIRLQMPSKSGFSLANRFQIILES